MIRSILYGAFLLLMVPLVVADFKMIIYSTGSSSPTTGNSSPTTGAVVNVSSPPPAMTAPENSQFRTEASLEFTNWTTGTSISNLTGAIVSAFANASVTPPQVDDVHVRLRSESSHRRHLTADGGTMFVDAPPGRERKCACCSDTQAEFDRES